MLLVAAVFGGYGVVFFGKQFGKTRYTSEFLKGSSVVVKREVKQLARFAHTV